MLTISGNQYKALAGDTRGRSYERISGYLRAHAPAAATMDQPQLYDFIARQEANAAPYGLTTEKHVAKWSWLALTVGEDFNRNPEVHGLLTRSDVTDPGIRLDRLCKAFALELDASNRRKR
jgi:hypothetical protein